MDRPQFTFYKSFDDTFEMLNDKQSLIYLRMLRDVQFLRVRIQDVSFDDPTLNVVWNATKHTLKTSIKGYLDSQFSEKVSIPFLGCYEGYDKRSDPFDTPQQGGADTPNEAGRMQVKDKGENKEEVKKKGKEEKETLRATAVRLNTTAKILNESGLDKLVAFYSDKPTMVDTDEKILSRMKRWAETDKNKTDAYREKAEPLKPIRDFDPNTSMAYYTYEDRNGKLYGQQQVYQEGNSWYKK